ncbi:HNH endonuclease signature motif containing protein [Ligilactobacillus araffinosus]|uniref:HNH nuclease domain-containing protein n=1 Tax=Ligilactobacillus araffinosus DSM 20653 TaxID=1423820 RepID=A0A0R1ZCD0_9LACO|nr:HNH endonuclease signature motif containing protein [Ligilactobacillus araffinosus]KRM52353.1 hypothetical protein FC64_GL000781 [Ligilactobacillus araffinosus DSM 20653]
MEMIKELKKSNATELYVMVMNFWDRNKIVKDKQGNLFTVLKDNQYLTQEEAKSHNEYFKKLTDRVLLSSNGYTYNLLTGYKNFGRDNNFGYLTISYQGKTTTMNNLVYKTFISDIPEGYVIHHLDHNPYNNNISNLAMITRGENLAERFKFNKNLGKEMASKQNKNYIYDKNSKILFKNKASVAQYVKGLIAGVTACLDGRFSTYKGLDLIQLSDQEQEKASSFNFFERGTKMVKPSQITL